jgi:hypothetical protein
MEERFNAEDVYLILRMKTERFIQLRQKCLEQPFSKEKLKDLWSKKVKHQLRGTEIRDIFDHYDFNYSIKSRVESIRSEILDGAYRAQKPLVIKIEKKMGICRHLIVPQPADALVLQAVTQVVSFPILKAQPSKNSFYSRDRGAMKLPHEVVDDYSTDWFSQWKKMQKTILGFSQAKKFIISTDITNYFDSIDIASLREVVLGYSKSEDKSGVLVDLMFGLIEDLSWRPDYLPYKRHGLPTINLESVRLLGHSFLYEVDDVLKFKTKENFTRWMDDITIGVDSREEAVLILGGISDVLKSSGLALNLAKTQLYTSSDYKYNFLIDQNRYLDTLKSIKVPSALGVKKFRKSFTKLLQDRKPQHWAKVAKRFITLHSQFNLRISERRLIELYIQYPLLRSHICKHLMSIGYSEWSKRVILNIVNNLDTKDDVALFNIANLLTSWNIPVSKKSEDFISEVCTNINLVEPFQFYCVLWIKAKYDYPDELVGFINKYQNKWKKEPFLRRQVTAVMSRVLKTDTKKIEQFLKQQAQSNDISTVSIANHILDFSEMKELRIGIYGYIFPTKLNFYSLERYLVLCSALNSPEIRNLKVIKEAARSYINDEYYKKWLDVTYDIR